jgi:hypothetical protein
MTGRGEPERKRETGPEAAGDRQGTPAVFSSVDHFPRKLLRRHARHIGIAGFEATLAKLVANFDRPHERRLGHGVTRKVVIRIRYGRDDAIVPLLDWIAEQNGSPNTVFRDKELILQPDRLSHRLSFGDIAAEVAQARGRTVWLLLRWHSDYARVVRNEFGARRTDCGS